MIIPCSRFNQFYYPLSGTKCVVKHQDLQMFGRKLSRNESFLPS